MTNDQLSGARRAQRRYPEVSFRVVTGGMTVDGVLVPIGPDMTAEEVYRALTAQVANNGA